VAFLGALTLGLAGPAHGVMFYATDDPEHNTRPPTGDLAGSGWDLLGAWGEFLGTPVAPNLFLTAQHIGGTVGDSFTFRGVQYPTLAFHPSPDSDLCLWQVCGHFPEYARLYTGAQEVGLPILVFGRGTQRGPAVVSGPDGSRINGWLWGSPDHRLRWGENVVTAIVDGDEVEGRPRARAGGLGEMLQADFDAGAGPNEAHLSTGDSGGAVFLRDDSGWKLAGINYGVDGPYNDQGEGEGFMAAVFDTRGLFIGGEGQWSLDPISPTAKPGAFYATRVAAHLDWIRGVIDTTAPLVPTAQAAPTPAGPFADVEGAVEDVPARTIILPLPPEDRFYRLRDCVARTILSITVFPDRLLLAYQ
jgi:hypothetical protein